jgi:hypothetical protein
VIGDPFSYGATQLTTMFYPELEVTGASGFDGATACKYVKMVDSALLPISL